MLRASGGKMLVAGKTNVVGKTIRDELGLIAGAATTLIFFTVGQDWLSDLSNMAWYATALIWLFAVMIWCAFGVVRHAEALAEILGEPYGTLVLTISVISIEVAVMATIMLGGGPNPTLPRETMFAILMIVMNGMVGLSLLIGAIRHGQQQYNLEGAVAFLAVIAPLSVIALIVPEFTQSTVDPTFTPLQATVFGLLTILLYGGFLAIQTMRHKKFFLDPKDVDGSNTSHQPEDEHHHMEIHSAPYHAVFLFITLLPVVLLAKPLAKLLDYGIEQLGAPIALGGILIAILVLSPEGVAAVQAAARNHMQRAVNLSLGSALATIGLTVPVVLTISVVTGHPLELGLGQVEIILLTLTLFVTQMTFSGVPTNVLLGGVHLVLFLAYIALVFSP